MYHFIWIRLVLLARLFLVKIMRNILVLNIVNITYQYLGFLVKSSCSSIYFHVSLCSPSTLSMKEFSQYCKTRRWVNVFWRKIIVPFQYNLLGLSSLSEAAYNIPAKLWLGRTIATDTWIRVNLKINQGIAKIATIYHSVICDICTSVKRSTVRVFSEAVSGANYSTGVWKAPQTPWACGGLGLYWANEINDRGAWLLVIK